MDVRIKFRMEESVIGMVPNQRLAAMMDVQILLRVEGCVIDMEQ